MNPSSPGENKIKESFEDENQNNIKELIHTHQDVDYKEILLLLTKHLNNSEHS